MRAYGVRRKDAGCCPGHDKYPPEPYECAARATHRRLDRHRKKAARGRLQRENVAMLNENIGTKEGE